MGSFWASVLVATSASVAQLGYLTIALLAACALLLSTIILYARTEKPSERPPGIALLVFIVWVAITAGLWVLVNGQVNGGWSWPS